MLRAVAIVFALLCACQPPLEKRARFFGRVDFSDVKGPRMAWSATGFSAKVSGTSVRFEIVDLPKHPDPEGRTWPNRFQVMLDDRAPEQLIVPADGRLRWSASALAAGQHRLTVFKQSEAFVGVAQLVALEADKFLPPDPAPMRRIELVGDSLTTGYGNEGTSKDCHFSEATQNQWLAWPSLTARALAAEHHVVAWSGKGVTRNYQDPKQPPPASLDPIDALTVPQIYGRTIPEDAASRWDFARWTPDVVIVGLGSNDISASDPGERAFVETYRGFIAKIREHNPMAQILCMIPPVEDAWPPNVHAWTRMRRYITAAARRLGDNNVHVIALPPEDPADGLGCDYHPTLARHAKVARAITETLQHVMSW